MPRLLSVHPHPDDESIACGGVLARYVEEGADVKVVTCTYGEAGENLAGIDLGGVDLTTHRKRELQDALEVLGITDHEYLGYRDSGMVDTDENAHPDSFHMADLYEAAGRLARTIRRFRPDVVISDGADGTYGHPDHVKAHRVVERAVVLAADAWWSTPADGEPWTVAKRYVFTFAHSRMLGMHRELLAAGLPSPFGEEETVEVAALPFGTPDAEVTTTIDVASWIGRKRDAMRAHRSQIGEDSFFLNVPEERATDVFGTEQFVLLQGEVAVPDGGGHETDLFAGLA